MIREGNREESWRKQSVIIYKAPFHVPGYELG